MNLNEIKNLILRYLAQITMKDPSTINLDMHLEADLGIDSLSMANLISKFEDIIMTQPDVNGYVQMLLTAQTGGELADMIAKK